jgi:hypothetical protein
MDIEKMINVELFKTISLDEAITLRGGISESDITKVWKKLNPSKPKKKVVKQEPEAED